MVSGMANVQGRAHVAASSTVTDHSTRSAAVRVARLQANALADVRTAVERNHSRLVNQLVADADDARRLHDLIRIAVDERHHRSRERARDAAIEQAEVLRSVERAVAKTAAGNRQPVHRIQGSGRGEPPLRQRRQAGNPAVRRINDQCFQEEANHW
jgi:hypothetical protein